MKVQQPEWLTRWGFHIPNPDGTNPEVDRPEPKKADEDARKIAEEIHANTPDVKL